MYFYFSQVYWFGDLNYRITELDATSVKHLVSKNQFKSVLEADQLKQQHRIGNVFKGYKEGPINFAPTYKYDPGTNDWDSRYVYQNILYLKIRIALNYY